MGRRPRNTLPAASDILRPKSQNLKSMKQSLQSVKDKQKASSDNKCNNKELLPLYPTDPVRGMPQQGKKEWIPGVIVRHHEAPRSYTVQVGNRQLRRNLKHLRHTKKMKQLMTNRMMEGFMSKVRPKKVHKNLPVWIKLLPTQRKTRTTLNKPLLALLRSQTPH